MTIIIHDYTMTIIIKPWLYKDYNFYFIWVASDGIESVCLIQ